MAKGNANGSANGQVVADNVGGNPPIGTEHARLDFGNDGTADQVGASRDVQKPPRKSDSVRGVDERERLTQLIQSFGDTDARAVQTDVEAMENWPCLWSCMTCTKTVEGKDRCPGEVRIEAQGSLWTVSLIMPEEERQIRCCSETLSGAMDTLEGALCSRPVPWVPCSKYAAKKRRTPKKKTT